MKKTVIFDLDGTLVDSIPDIFETANYIRKINNCTPLSIEKVTEFMGDGINIFVEKLFKDTNKVPDNAVNDFINYYSKNIVNKTRLFEGITQVLKYLKNNDFIIGILSNKSEKLTKKVANKLNFDYYFKFIYGGDSFLNKKPSPIPVFEIIKQHNLNKDNTFIVGDSENDINCGKQSGIQTIAVTYGYTNKKQLLKLNPDFTVENPLQLKQIF